MFTLNQNGCSLKTRKGVHFGPEYAKSARPEQNRQAVEDFVSRLVILPYGDKASQHYGEIRAELEKAGTPIGVNDLHISAHSRSESIILVSNDVTEFRRVNGLRLENWIK